MKHSIHIPNETFTPEAVPMGGTSPSGQIIQVNQRYLMLDGQP